MKKKTIIILSLVLAIILLIGVCSYSCFHYFSESAKNIQIVIEDLHSGSKKQLTNKGINIHPQFSNSGNYIYFLYRPPEGSKNQLLVYSIKDMKTIKSIISNTDTMTFTTSVLFDKGVLCYLKNSNSEDVCLYAINNRKTLKLTNDNNKKSNALISPDGRWISYIEEDAKDSRNNVCIVPSAGGEKRKISSSSGMLSDVKIYCWSNDSGSICYITFLSLIIKSVRGAIIEKIDLTGLNNFKSILSDPQNSDRLYIFAREAAGDLSFSIFTVSKKERIYKLYKENRSFWEMNYAISPDGARIVYSDNVN